MAGESEQISQDEIEKLLSQSKSAAGTPSPDTAASVRPSAANAAEDAASGRPYAASAPEEPPTLGPRQVEALRQSAQDQTSLTPRPRDSAAVQAGLEAPPSVLGGGGSAAAASRPAGSTGLPASDIEFLFQQAEQALASVQGPHPTPPGVSPYKLVDFAGAPPSTEIATLDLLRDVELDLKIELGRTHMYLEDVLRLSKGAVVPLDRLAGDPVDIYVNGRLIARGEVLILNDNFCVRVAELVAGESPAASAS
jgi:flagellar motor switch protein FliN